MAETAVGLFEHSGAAEAIVDALRENGIPSNAIRVVKESAGLANESSTGTYATDITSALTHDLKSMGASEIEIADYLADIKSGGALVFVTGDTEQIATATELMNEFFATEVEEFATVGSGRADAALTTSDPRTAVDNSAESTASSADPNTTAKIEHHRNRTEGARVFAW